MSLNKESCECCGNSRDRCPECNGHMVTPLDNPEARKPTEIAIYGEDEEVEEYKNVCWECGWSERVTVTIEREPE